MAMITTTSASPRRIPMGSQTVPAESASLWLAPAEKISARLGPLLPTAKPAMQTVLVS